MKASNDSFIARQKFPALAVNFHPQSDQLFQTFLRKDQGRIGRFRPADGLGG